MLIPAVSDEKASNNLLWPPLLSSLSRRALENALPPYSGCIQERVLYLDRLGLGHTCESFSSLYIFGYHHESLCKQDRNEGGHITPANKKAKRPVVFSKAMMLCRIPAKDSQNHSQEQ
jgi:hypothetical protein